MYPISDPLCKSSQCPLDLYSLLVFSLRIIVESAEGSHGNHRFDPDKGGKPWRIPNPSHLELSGVSSRRHGRVRNSSLKAGTPKRQVYGTRSSIEITQTSTGIVRPGFVNGT